jgi:hypothetical protein
MSLLNRVRIPELVLYGTMPLPVCAIVALTAFRAVDYVRDRRRAAAGTDH